MPAEPNELARRQLAQLAEATLVKSGAAGVLPTPLDIVRASAGVVELIDIAGVPETMMAAKPSGMKRILGAYLFSARTAFVDMSQNRGRKRFIEAHETSHQIIPWHKQSFCFDDELRLFRETEELLDSEANLLAAHLLFQGRRFHNMALDYETTLKTPIALADMHAASYHATIRYFAEFHPEPVAVIVAGNLRWANGNVPVWQVVESPSFAKAFPDFRASFGRQGVSTTAATNGLQLCNPATEAIGSSGKVAEGETALVDGSGKTKVFDVEAFNQRSLFLFLTPRQRVRRGRRIELARPV